MGPALLETLGTEKLSLDDWGAMLCREEGWESFDFVPWTEIYAEGADPRLKVAGAAGRLKTATPSAELREKTNAK